MGLSSEEFFFTLSTKGKKASSRYFKKIVAACIEGDDSSIEAFCDITERLAFIQYQIDPDFDIENFADEPDLVDAIQKCAIPELPQGEPNWQYGDMYWITKSGDSLIKKSTGTSGFLKFVSKVLQNNVVYLSRAFPSILFIILDHKFVPDSYKAIYYDANDALQDDSWEEYKKASGLKWDEDE